MREKQAVLQHIGRALIQALRQPRATAHTLSYPFRNPGTAAYYSTVYPAQQVCRGLHSCLSGAPGALSYPFKHPGKALYNSTIWPLKTFGPGAAGITALTAPLTIGGAHIMRSNRELGGDWDFEDIMTTSSPFLERLLFDSDMLTSHLGPDTLPAGRIKPELVRPYTHGNWDEKFNNSLELNLRQRDTATIGDVGWRAGVPAEDMQLWDLFQRSQENSNLSTEDQQQLAEGAGRLDFLRKLFATPLKDSPEHYKAFTDTATAEVQRSFERQKADALAFENSWLNRLIGGPSHETTEAVAPFGKWMSRAYRNVTYPQRWAMAKLMKSTGDDRIMNPDGTLHKPRLQDTIQAATDNIRAVGQNTQALTCPETGPLARAGTGLEKIVGGLGGMFREVGAAAPAGLFTALGLGGGYWAMQHARRKRQEAADQFRVRQRRQLLGSGLSAKERRQRMHEIDEEGDAQEQMRWRDYIMPGAIAAGGLGLGGLTYVGLRNAFNKGIGEDAEPSQLVSLINKGMKGFDQAAARGLRWTANKTGLRNLLSPTSTGPSSSIPADTPTPAAPLDDVTKAAHLKTAWRQVPRGLIDFAKNLGYVTTGGLAISAPVGVAMYAKTEPSQAKPALQALAEGVTRGSMYAAGADEKNLISDQIKQTWTNASEGTGDFRNTVLPSMTGAAQSVDTAAQSIGGLSNALHKSLGDVGGIGAGVIGGGMGLGIGGHVLDRNRAARLREANRRKFEQELDLEGQNLDEDEYNQRIRDIDSEFMKNKRMNWSDWARPAAIAAGGLGLGTLIGDRVSSNFSEDGRSIFRRGLDKLRGS